MLKTSSAQPSAFAGTAAANTTTCNTVASQQLQSPAAAETVAGSRKQGTRVLPARMLVNRKQLTDCSADAVTDLRKRDTKALPKWMLVAMETGTDSDSDYDNEDCYEDKDHHWYSPCSDPWHSDECLRSSECCCRSSGYWGRGQKDIGISWYGATGVVYEDEDLASES